MYVKFSAGGIVELFSQHPVDGYVKAPDGVPLNRIGWDGAKCIDLSSVSTFYIDEAGQKNLVQASPAWQKLPCLIDDVLLRGSNGTWAVTTADWRSVQRQAVDALNKSDITVLRCYEAGVPLPPEWKAYRAALRAIVASATGDATKPLPVQPPYPSGT